MNTDPPEPGWYPDPDHDDGERYWTGSSWGPRRPTTEPGPDAQPISDRPMRPLRGRTLLMLIGAATATLVGLFHLGTSLMPGLETHTNVHAAPPPHGSFVVEELGSLRCEGLRPAGTRTIPIQNPDAVLELEPTDNIPTAANETICATAAAARRAALRRTALTAGLVAAVAWWLYVRVRRTDPAT